MKRKKKEKNTMSDDFGDVSGFEKPTVPDEVVNTLISLVIN